MLRHFPTVTQILASSQNYASPWSIKIPPYRLFRTPCLNRYCFNRTDRNHFDASLSFSPYICHGEETSDEIQRMISPGVSAGIYKDSARIPHGFLAETFPKAGWSVQRSNATWHRAIQRHAIRHGSSDGRRGQRNRCLPYRKSLRTAGTRWRAWKDAPQRRER